MVELLMVVTIHVLHSAAGGEAKQMTGERRDTLLLHWLAGAVRRVEGAEVPRSAS